MMVTTMKTRANDNFYSLLFEPEFISPDRAQIVAFVLVCIVVGVISIIAYRAARRPEP
jgi:hypothetical protein